VRTVLATREGLPGQRTASGYLIDDHVPFVALPSAAALHQPVIVNYPKTGKSIRAIVLDVGPWNVNDNAYVFGTARPQAEAGLDVSHNGKTNGAGIDLGQVVWDTLGLTDNDHVSWKFEWEVE
jgi:hypothetical protein